MLTKRRFLLFYVICISLAWADKPAKAKSPDVELFECSAKVEDQRLMIDGRIRNVSDRTLRRLMVYYEVLDSDKKVLTRQQGSLDESELEPGKEAAFSAQMQSHARAVYYRFEVTDGNGRELRGANTGPFPLEE